MAKTRGGKRRPAGKKPTASRAGAARAKVTAKKAGAKKAAGPKKTAGAKRTAGAKTAKVAGKKTTKAVSDKAKKGTRPKATAKRAAAKRAPVETRKSPARARKGAAPRPPAPVATQPSGGRPEARVAPPLLPPLSSPRPPRDSSTMDDDVRPSLRARAMDLSWEEWRATTEDEVRVDRWVERGGALLRELEAHGCARHEYRADLKDGRFVWVDEEGSVSAEAKAQVLCSWSRSTNVLVMGWADPLVRTASTARLDGMPNERDDVSEEEAWRVAMAAADEVHAEYLYRVPAPHAWYFLALQKITFSPASQEFTPSTPVGLVLRSLEQTRAAIESRAEPSAIVRERLADVGSALLREASFAYRDTDWVSRLERTGRCLMTLANRLPRPSYSSIAAGRSPEEWLTREATLDLIQSIGLLEDEWALFA